MHVVVVLETNVKSIASRCRDTYAPGIRFNDGVTKFSWQPWGLPVNAIHNLGYDRSPAMNDQGGLELVDTLFQWVGRFTELITSFIELVLVLADSYFDHTLFLN